MNTLAAVSFQFEAQVLSRNPGVRPLQQARHDGVSKISNMSAQVVPSCPSQHKQDSMERSWGLSPRTIQDRSAERNDVLSMKQKFRLALVSDFGHLKSPAKEIARKAGCSPRTVEAWIEGRSLPGFEYVWRLGRHSPAIQKLFLEMISYDMDLDPRAYGAFLELQRMMQR